MKIAVDRVREGLEDLARFGGTPGAGVSRLVFSPADLLGRAYIKERMKDAGLAVSEDAIGNIFGTLPGTEPELAPVWTGSHIDTVLRGGRFDGMAGTIGAIEALRAIGEAGASHRRTLTAVVYTGEEPSVFGIGCLGSRAMAGVLDLEMAKAAKNEAGKSLYDTLAELGYDVDRLDAVRRRPGDVHAAIEMHIEQGPKLERSSCRLGVVTDICAPAYFNVWVEGLQSHAGGTSMADRRDAFAATAEISMILERLVKEAKSVYATGTIGKVDVIPNALNVIPGRVHFTIDIRNTSDGSTGEILAALREEMKRIERERGVLIRMETINRDLPVHCEDSMQELLAAICKRRGIPHERLISGAFHDSMFVGAFAPVAMLFLPSRNGVSHCPEEWTDYEDVALGAEVLAEALLVKAGE